MKRSVGFSKVMIIVLFSVFLVSSAIGKSECKKEYGSLIKANEVNGYFMTDSSTWVAGKKNLDNLKVLFRGDPMLINTYHGLCQPKGATKN